MTRLDRLAVEEENKDKRALAEIAARREEWLGRMELEGKHKILFELEMLLKGLDRFFNVTNLPIANIEDLININFSDEMGIVLQFIDRVAELSGQLLDASRQDDYQFRFYVENKLLGDYERTRWREKALDQATPEDSLFVLYSSFLNVREMVRSMLLLSRIPYSLFFNTGSMLSREIVSSRFFNPSRPISFRPEYDRIDNLRIRRIVRSIDDPPLQRQVSTVVLAFNRLLRYLAYINPLSESMEGLKSSLLFFALIHSEAKYLMLFMENNLPRAVAAADHPQSGAFAEMCDSLSFQLMMELKKIQSNELLNLAKHQELDHVRIGVENSHGILKNFFQQSILQILLVFESGLAGEEIFPVFVSRRRQSIQLREDIAVFQTLMDKFEEITETSAAGASLDTFIKYLLLQKKWIKKMRKDTVPLMRYQDLVEFEKYFKFIDDLKADDLHLMDNLDRFKMESKFFKIFIQTTLSHLANRSELQDFPLNPKRVEDLLKRFIADSGQQPLAAETSTTE